MQREATCLTDSTASTYCFVNATVSTATTVRHRRSAELTRQASYLYFLPSGSGIPQNTPTSCDDCSRAVMGVYACVVRGLQS